MLGKPRRNKNLKLMTETERIEHLKQLNRDRRNRCYRKKILQQQQQQSNKQNEIRIRTQKINFDNNNDQMTESEKEQFTEILHSLIDIFQDEQEWDKLTYEEQKKISYDIDVYENVLDYKDEDKLNLIKLYNGDYDSDYDSD
jgi:hypothetical protein